MELGGYANKVAWVDLSAGKVEFKPIAEDDARKYIGGRGLGQGGKGQEFHTSIFSLVDLRWKNSKIVTFMRISNIP